ALAPHRRANDRAGARGCVSTPRIRGDGLIPTAVAINPRVASDLPRADAPGRPSYRGRSPVLAVLLQILHELAQCHYRLPRRWATTSKHGRRKPTLADRLGQQRIPKQWAATRLRWHNFRHHTITVGDQDGFPASSEADIFTELVFEHFQADCTHRGLVATGSYFVNPSSPITR